MSVKFVTATPQALLNKFNAAIEQKEEKGRVNTWKRSDDKKYYTHVSAQWGSKAWFKPVVADGNLIFFILKPQNSKVTAVVWVLSRAPYRDISHPF